MFTGSSSDSSDQEDTESGQEMFPERSKKIRKKIPVWFDVPRGKSETPFPEWNKIPSEDHELGCPVDYFKYFFDESIVENIANQSNLYSVQKNVNKPLNTNPTEIEQFIGVCAYMSVYNLPRSRMYWSFRTRIDKIGDVMSRSRWEEIKANLHFNDNTRQPSLDNPDRDRLFKIRPLVDALQDKYKHIPFENQMLCVDEQTVPFKGSSSLKQYNPQKPHKWGYKIFVLSDQKGLIHNFIIYSGQIKPVDDFPDIGQSSNIVLQLIQHVPINENHLLYFDNWYSSPMLFVTLANMGIAALGTVRINRFPGLEFSSDKDMKKKGRGSVEEKVSEIDGIPIRAIKWYDNKGVVMATTFDSCEPQSSIERFERKIKTQVEVKCPRAITTYNKFMGGVDLIDGLISYYRTKIRSKKYYLRFFFHFIDMAIVSAWLLYRKDCEKEGIRKQTIMDLLEFKIEVAESLCKEGKDLTKRGRPSTSASSVDYEHEDKEHRGPAKPIPTPMVRRDSVGHWPTFTDERQRCRHPFCKDKSYIKCEKCHVHLCIKKVRNCFVDFHK